MCFIIWISFLNKTNVTEAEFLTMLKYTEQQTLVRDGIPPQSWQLRVVRIWHPDLYLTKEKEEEEEEVKAETDIM